MTSVKASGTDPTDPDQEVAEEIRRAIAEGAAKPGERLPPAKDLAAVLGVNTTTVLRPAIATPCNCCATRVCSSSAAAAGFSIISIPSCGAVVGKSP